LKHYVLIITGKKITNFKNDRGIGLTRQGSLVISARVKGVSFRTSAATIELAILQAIRRGSRIGEVDEHLRIIIRQAIKDNIDRSTLNLITRNLYRDLERLSSTI